MKTTRIMALAVLIVGGGFSLHVARAHQPGIIIAAGTIHAAKNVGSGNGVELAT